MWGLKFQKTQVPLINFVFPLPDNLFKPKERFIPEKEMHMRSKRYKPLEFSLQSYSLLPHTGGQVRRASMQATFCFEPCCCKPNPLSPLEASPELRCCMEVTHLILFLSPKWAMFFKKSDFCNIIINNLLYLFCVTDLLWVLGDTW